MARKDSTGKGRKRKLPRAAREQQMLDVAARVFGRRGFHAASMDEVARSCGITKPMLYAYFGSKEGLFLATVDRTGKALVAEVEKLLGEPDPRVRLQRGVRTILQFIERDRSGWEVLYAEGLGEDPVAEHVSGYRNRIIKLAALTLGQAAPTSLLTAAGRKRAELYAVGLLGAGEAVVRWWLDGQRLSFGEMQAQAQRIIDAFLDDFCEVTRRRSGAGAEAAVTT